MEVEKSAIRAVCAAKRLQRRFTSYRLEGTHEESCDDMRIARKALVLGAVALVAAAGYATAAAQAQDQQTPKGWSYEIKDGKRVPKGNRVTNAGRQLARGSPPGQLRDDQGDARRPASIRKLASATRAVRASAVLFRFVEAAFRPLLDRAGGKAACRATSLAVADLGAAVGSGEDRPVARRALVVDAMRHPHVEVLVGRRRSRRR